MAEFLPRKDAPCWSRDVHTVAVKGTKLFLCSALYPAGGKGGLTVLDIARPASPQVLWEDASVWAADLGFCGEELLVAYGAHGWAVLRAEGQGWRRISGIGPAPVFGLARRLHLIGDCAYVAAPDRTGYIAGGHRGYILDVSDPDSPKLIKPAPHGCVGFYTVRRGNLAFVLGDRLFTVDVSDPRAPVVRGSAGPCGTGKAATDRFPYVFVADADMGVQVFKAVKRPAVWKGEAEIGSCGIHYGPIWKGGPMWYFGTLGLRPYRTLERESELVRIKNPLLILGLCDLRKDEGYVAVVAEGATVLLIGPSRTPSQPLLGTEQAGGKILTLRASLGF